MKDVLLAISMLVNVALAVHIEEMKYDVDRIIGGVQAYVFDSHPRAERVTVVCPEMRYNTKGIVMCGVEFAKPGEFQREVQTVICESTDKTRCARFETRK